MGRMDKSVAESRYYTSMDSPVGELFLLGNDRGLCAIHWDKESSVVDIDQYEHVVRKDRHPILARARKQLQEYFAGKRTEFDVPLDLHGTPFQLEVWAKLLEIPYGETACYEEQARKIGDINKVRAVGGANGKNPVSIIVPCHRVIGKNGSLTGFGGGLDRKKLLLELESHQRRLSGLE